MSIIRRNNCIYATLGILLFWGQSPQWAVVPKEEEEEEEEEEEGGGGGGGGEEEEEEEEKKEVEEEEDCQLHHSTLKMDAADSFKILIPVCRTTRRHVPQQNTERNVFSVSG